MNRVRRNTGTNIADLGYSEANEVLSRMLAPQTRNRYGATGYNFRLNYKLHRMTRGGLEGIDSVEPGVISLAWLAQFLVNRAKSGDLKLVLSYGPEDSTIHRIDEFIDAMRYLTSQSEPGVDEIGLFDADGTYIGSFFSH
jgi:hypothetical protein